MGTRDSSHFYLTSHSYFDLCEVHQSAGAFPSVWDQILPRLVWPRMVREWEAHPRRKISSHFRCHGSHITFILCAGDWGLTVPVGWFSLIYVFLKQSVLFHAMAMKNYPVFIWTISFSYNTNKAKTSTMLTKKVALRFGEHKWTNKREK